MNKIITRYSCLMFLAAALTACSHNDEPEEDPIAERTVLVYMSAENDLSSFALSDLDEMKQASRSLKDNQQLVAYIDRADTIPPFYARIKDGAFVDSVSVSESSSADPAVLEAALSYVRTHYPSRSYGLVLWGHASGWLVSNDSIPYNHSRAYGGDTETNSASRTIKHWMNIPSMAVAVNKGMGGTPLKFIMGDCCSFGCVEVAYELRHVAEYVIGSPAEVPDDGAPFDLVIPEMFSQRENFYQAIIDEYYQFYKEEYENRPQRYYNTTVGDLKGYSVPLAAVKTSELDQLASATSQLLASIHDRLTPTGDLDFTPNVYYAMYSSYRYSYDMYQMLKNNTSATEFNTWAAAFNKAVPYRVTSTRWLTGYSQLGREMVNFDDYASDCGVLSMFFPRTIYKSTNPNWNLAIRKFQWNNSIHWEDYDW